MGTQRPTTPLCQSGSSSIWKKSLNVNLKLSSVARLLTGLPLRSSLSSGGALAAAFGGVLAARWCSAPLAPRRWRRPCGKDAATWAWAFNDSTIWYVYVHIHKSFGKHYDHLLCMTVVYSIIVLVEGCFWIGPRLPCPSCLVSTILSIDISARA